MPYPAHTDLFNPGPTLSKRSIRRSVSLVGVTLVDRPAIYMLYDAPSTENFQANVMLALLPSSPD